MNDPHVESLVYLVEHDFTVEYVRAAPLELQTQDFKIRVESGEATFTPKGHYATSDQARAVAERFIDEWQLETLLSLGPNQFRLKYKNTNLIDRQPDERKLSLTAETGRIILTGASAVLRVSRTSYPLPPTTSLKIDGDIEVMRERYLWSRSDKEPIAATAYFCVTMLESEFRVASAKPRAPSGARRRAAEKCFIDLDVLEMAGELSSEKGGPGARKAGGVSSPLTDAERNWLDAAMRMMIRRFAEYKADPAKTYPQITMADLPKL